MRIRGVGLRAKSRNWPVKHHQLPIKKTQVHTLIWKISSALWNFLLCVPQPIGSLMAVFIFASRTQTARFGSGPIAKGIQSNSQVRAIRSNRLGSLTFLFVVYPRFGPQPDTVDAPQDSELQMTRNFEMFGCSLKEGVQWVQFGHAHVDICGLLWACPAQGCCRDYSLSGRSGSTANFPSFQCNRIAWIAWYHKKRLGLRATSCLRWNIAVKFFQVQWKSCQFESKASFGSSQSCL